MATKAHFLDPRAIVRSVLNGTEATAACGLKKVFTRDGVESASAGGLKTCKGCLVAIGENVAKGDEVTLHPAEGWTALLERVWKLQEADRYRPMTFTFTNGNATTWNFPLAA